MANNWITLTEDHVETSLNALEVAAYRQKKTTCEEDPLAGVLADVTSEVRGACLSAGMILPASGIPPSLKTAALDIIVWRLAKRLQLANEAQRWPAAEKAYKRLDMVADGKRAVESPEDLTQDGTLGDTEVVSSVTRVCTNDALKGL